MITINKIKDEIENKIISTKKKKIIEFASKHKNLALFKSSDNEITYWFIICIFLILYLDYDTQKAWETFATEIKTKNRFFPESELLKNISDIAEQATCFIEKGKILYRARDYSEQDFLKNDTVIAVGKIIKDELSNIKFDTADIANESAISIICLYLCRNEKKRKKVIRKIDKILTRNTCFYGFDKQNSDAPLYSDSKEGRANPKGISYLYTAKDIKTAILEMRPQMHKMYNVATIKIIQKAKIFNFTYQPQKTNENEHLMVTILHRISEEFSKPNLGTCLEYAPTQFVCEYIKRLGYDGIMFKSAVSETGTNVLLFDINENSRVYDVIGSKVYTVDALTVDISQIIPIENEKGTSKLLEHTVGNNDKKGNLVQY